MQGNLIGEAETAGSAREVCTKFIAPYNRPAQNHTAIGSSAGGCREATEWLARLAQFLHYLTNMHLAGRGDPTHRCARAAQSFRKDLFYRP